MDHAGPANRETNTAREGKIACQGWAVMQALHVSKEGEILASKTVVDFDVHPTKPWVVLLYGDGTWTLWDYLDNRQTHGTPVETHLTP